MLYGEGISKEGEALALGEKLGLVQKSSGGAYSMGETKMGRGYDAARTYLKENKPVLTQLLKDIRKGLQDGGGVIGKSSSAEE
jgi:recombination protein RecA